MNILLLAGGFSNEKEISMKSGDNIEAALLEVGHKVKRADPAQNDFDLGRLSSSVDMVFPILHGEGGEDGKLQAELEKLGIPYLGSTPSVMARTFDKVKYKELLAEHGILTPSWQVVTKESFSSAGLIHKSFVLKPIKGGSSIDTFIIYNPQHQALNFDEPLGRYRSMLLEELIEGREITVGVLGDEVLPVILVIPPSGEKFDYENKYNGRTQEIPNPLEIPIDVQEKAQGLALTVHNLMGCRHFSRTDIIITSNGSLYVLETNTIPGLTEQSLLPKAAKASGMEVSGLVEKMVMLVKKDTITI